MKKLPPMLQKVASLVLVVTAVLSMNLPAFAQSADASPNLPSRPSSPNTNNSVVIPADVKPAKSYTAIVGKTYNLPADAKQVGDSYSSSNSSILKVDGATGKFTALANGTAYIIVANNGGTRYIKITVGTGTTTATQAKSVLTGYTVTVNDKTIIATGCNFTMVDGVEKCLFLSANGNILGSMSANDYRKIGQAGIDNGTLPTDSRGLAKWFAGEFNKYRGLSATAGVSNSTSTNTNTPATTNTKSNASTLASLINEQRNKDGLSELTYDSSMQSIADERARELVDKFSHERPDGTRVSKEYYYAEIIHSGSETASGAFQNYYNSTAHRNIMLSEQYNYYVVGCYKAENGKICWVVLFSE